MLEFKDRQPVDANRKLIIPEVGDPFYATVEFADNATQVGTSLNRSAFMAFQGMENGTTVFNIDGSITETFSTGVLTTTFPDADTVIETFVPTTGTTIVKTTTFGIDGNITEVLS